MSPVQNSVPQIRIATDDVRHDVADEGITNQTPSATPHRPPYVQLSRNNSILISPGPLITPGSTLNTDQCQTYRILPIIAGVLIPFLVLLSIPSLTNHWYVQTDGASATVKSAPNPLLLDVAMGLSMACGVLANVCLILRFTERNVKKMTLLCIISLSMNGSCVSPETFIFSNGHKP
jgi:hypothetical protein